MKSSTPRIITVRTHPLLIPLKHRLGTIFGNTPEHIICRPERSHIEESAVVKTAVAARYYRDGKGKIAASAEQQYSLFHRVASTLSADKPLFVLHENSLASVLLKTALEKHHIPAFSVQRHFFRPNDFVALPISCDLGSPFRDPGKQKKLITQHASAIPDDKPDLPRKVFSDNPRIAVDIPPDTIPGRYLGLLRNEQHAAGGIISLLSSRPERHQTIILIPPAAEPETFRRWQKLFGVRACVKSESIPHGTTVVTWSTHRFFHFLNHGYRPVVPTRSLAGSLFPRRAKHIRNVVAFPPHQDSFNRLVSFIDGVMRLTDDYPFTSLLSMTRGRQ